MSGEKASFSSAGNSTEGRVCGSPLQRPFEYLCPTNVGCLNGSMSSERPKLALSNKPHAGRA